jgi:hypothetical protein
MVRGKITEHYQKEISFCYTPEGKEINNAINKSAVEKWNKKHVGSTVPS